MNWAGSSGLDAVYLTHIDPVPRCNLPPLAGQPKIAGTRRPQLSGICEDAQTLGVTRAHLHKVLHGERRSAPLMKRYKELQRQKALRVLEGVL